MAHAAAGNAERRDGRAQGGPFARAGRGRGARGRGGSAGVRVATRVRVSRSWVTSTEVNPPEAFAKAKRVPSASGRAWSWTSTFRRAEASCATRSADADAGASSAGGSIAIVSHASSGSKSFARRYPSKASSWEGGRGDGAGGEQRRESGHPTREIVSQGRAGGRGSRASRDARAPARNDPRAWIRNRTPWVFGDERRTRPDCDVGPTLGGETCRNFRSSAAAVSASPRSRTFFRDDTGAHRGARSTRTRWWGSGSSVIGPPGPGRPRTATGCSTTSSSRHDRAPW